ncbi:MAG: dihydrolipoyl dehydrogenase [Candidatus Bipolaricaulia bacterium]
MVVGDIAVGTEVLVIGAGPGGYVAAIRAAQLGKEVTLVDADKLGGVCLNYGCIPSKALITAAHFFDRITAWGDRGIEVDGVQVNFEKLQAWKAGVVKRLVSGVDQLCKGNSVEVIFGRASFTATNRARIEIEAGIQHIEFKHAIIATGSRSIELPGFEFDGERILSSRHTLDLDEIPERLLVIGGGYIGLELGDTYAKLGSQVTVIELTGQLLPGTDPDLVKVVERRLKKDGVTVHLNTQATGVEDEDQEGSIQVTVAHDEQTETLEVDRVLVTVGRRPNSEGFGLEEIGVEVDDQGFIVVDQQLSTSVPRIYAIGDVAGGPMLAHKASHEGIIAAEVIAGLPSAADYVAVPAVIFTDPEIATVGLTEAQANEQGYETITGRFPFAALGRALTTGETAGFVKIVADAETEVVLGVHIVGPEASNLISEATLALEMAATVEDLALTIHPHPTLPESLMEAAEDVVAKAIHILRR